MLQKCCSATRTQHYVLWTYATPPGRFPSVLGRCLRCCGVEHLLIVNLPRLEKPGRMNYRPANVSAPRRLPSSPPARVQLVSVARGKQRPLTCDSWSKDTGGKIN